MPTNGCYFVITDSKSTGEIGLFVA